MFVLGITGGIGCGKSTAADYFRGKNLCVIDADQLSFDVTQAGGKALEEVLALFGADILDEAGNMDRGKVAAVVFNDKKMLDKLSAIIHRHVLTSMAEEIKKAKKRREKLCVLDVPIPVKEGFLDQCDYVMVIWSKDELRLQRLRERGMTDAEAKRRMAMQMTREEYASLAQELIENDETIAALHEKLDAFYTRELLSRGIRI